MLRRGPGPGALALVLLAAAILLVAVPAAAHGGAHEGDEDDTEGPPGGAFGSPQEHHLEIPMLDAATVWTGERAILFGGRNGTGPKNVTQSFDPATGETSVLEARLPNETQAAGAAWTGDEAYVFGGAGLTLNETQVVDEGEVYNVTRVEVDPHDQILRYDPTSGAVTRHEASLPDEVFGLSAAQVGDVTYIIGGVNRSEVEGTVTAHNQDWILRFDPSAEDPVERVGTFPVPIRDAAATTHDGDVYVFGGIVERGDGSDRTFEPTDAIYRYDPETGDVTTVDATLGAPMRWFSLSKVGDRAYLFGGCQEGCEDPDRDPVDAVQRFNFTTGQLDVLEPRITWNATVATMSFYDGTDAWVLGGGQGPQRYDVVFDNVTRFIIPPSEPRNVDAQPTGAGIQVTWERPAFPGGGVTSYAVDRARTGASPQRIATLDADVRSYNDTTAKPETEYTYRVRAVGHGGPSPPSDPTTVTAPTRPPAEPQHLEAAGFSDAVLVRWDEPATDGGEPIQEYKVYRNGSLLDTTSNLSLEDADVDVNVTYTYAVSAVNAKGEGPQAGPVEGSPADRLPPPQDVTVRPGNNSISVRWQPPEEGTPDEYQVLRGPAWNNLSVLDTVDQGPYTDADVEQGTAYWYAVAAVNGSQVGLASKAQRGAVLTPPGPPANLSVQAEVGTVVVRWDRPVDDGGAEDVFYNVIRIDEAGDRSFLNPDFWDETSWIDRDVENGSVYEYAVEAVTAGGTGPEAGPIQVRVPVPNTPPVARLTVTPETPEAGSTAVLDATGSSDEQGPVVQARFDFGDGDRTAWRTELRANHTYDKPGTYQAQVWVRDLHGNVSTPATLNVTVAEAPDEPGDDGTGNETVDEAPGSGDDGFMGVPSPTTSLTAAAALAASLLRRSRREG